MSGFTHQQNGFLNPATAVDQKQDAAVLVHVDLGIGHVDDVHEFKELVASAGVDVAHVVVVKKHTPEARYFVGSGKVDELRQQVELIKHQSVSVIFNHELSPAQKRNLEKALETRVLDRTELILDIFAQRARTYEGKLQVELAQLKHLSTRLIRGWTHLERQKGGIGLRGPGETQLETDRRLIGVRIKQLQKRLDKVARQRDLSRQSRQKAEIPTLSLVGYTNAGKSTLFNALTSADVYAADQLFATLDPTLRQFHMNGVGKVVMADTVGFVRDLPHDLVAAFKSTLLETREAHLLLHVVDASAQDKAFNQEKVNEVLQQIEADGVPQLLVFNKLDKLDDVEPRIETDKNGKPVAVYCSAKTGVGIELVTEAMQTLLTGFYRSGWLQLGFDEGQIRAQLYALGVVEEEDYELSEGVRLRVTLPEAQIERLGLQNHIWQTPEPMTTASAVNS